MAEDGPRFTHTEMRLIFERAVEAERSGDIDRDRRYSLADIQAIASEAGLDRHAVERAAVSVRSASTNNRWLGAPSRFHESRTLDQRLSDGAINDVVVGLRQTTALHGELRVVPGGIEWRARTALGVVIVDFTPKRAGTRVDVLVARDDLAAVATLCTGIGGLLAGLAVGQLVGLHAGVVAGIGAGAVTAVGSAWAAARLIWSKISRGSASMPHALIEQVAEAASRRPDE
jgi:hypothetical protein